MGKIFKRFYLFLGSLFLAVVILLFIATALAWGTFYEVRYGTAAVQRFVYRSWWFQGMLGFLALNLALAAVHRFPWKRKHVPFLLAHLGLILVLIGAILGGVLGVEGRLVIPEGGTQSVLDLPEKVLAVYEPNPGRYVTFPVALEATAWDQEPDLQFDVPLKDRVIRLMVEKYLPDAERLEEVRPGAAGDPAMIRLTASSGGKKAQTWLRLNDPARSAASWGDVEVFFTELTDRQLKEIVREAQSPAKGRGEILLTFQDGSAAAVPVPGKTGQTVAVKGTAYRVTFKDYFPDFTVTENGVGTLSQEPRNPAVGFLLTGPEGQDSYLLFAKHPDFQQVHGIKHLIPVQAVYRHPATRAFPPHTFGIVQTGPGSLCAVFSGHAGQVKLIPHIAAGQTLKHPWMDYQFIVEEILPHGRIDADYVNRSNQVRMEALKIKALQGGQEARGWVTTGGSVDLPVGEEPVRVEYRSQRMQLPFAVKLLDFKRIDYPGTQIAEEFASDVELIDPRRGAVLRKTVSMNNPIRYRGYTLFQASYIDGPVQATVLLTRNDPGTPLVFSGFLAVIGGMVLLFTSRKGTPGRAAASARLLTLAATGLGLLWAQSAWAADEPFSEESRQTLERMAIQHNGRVKPFDSFARETVRLLTGCDRWERQPPLRTVLEMAAQPEKWEREPVLSVPFKPLRESLGLAKEKTHVSYQELVETRRLMQKLPAIVQKQQKEQSLSMLENETWDLYNRFVTLNGLFENRLHLVPPASSVERNWLPVLTPAGHPLEKQQAVRQGWNSLLSAIRSQDAPLIEKAAGELSAILTVLNEKEYPAAWRIDLELAYNRLEPFSLARWFYAAAFLLLAASLSPRRRWAGAAGMGILSMGFLIHLAGITLRVILGGRPPVSNFFETILWLPFVGVIIALILERIYRVRMIALSAAFVAATALTLAEHVPLDPSISPVVAVLRSNKWLTIHVLTIVASYGALALAAVLAHLYGIFFLRRAGEEILKQTDLFLYRTIQVGIVLLASGIMLGAVWANASWGRYWGWDPKETWALITLLWFLAILHGRIVGWVKPLGTALLTIGGFFLLLMTYYGVSFYLVGLHSYAGGNAKPLPPLLVIYVAAELVFISVVGFRAVFFKRTS
ncbi:MAG: cytochrome c biogenesis protein CcsA [Candidatus Omnitrophica bacterium]|nr:cytochrome c biogenesis protein CcsA [Candidatus Omnitrophota bacterium]